jgi:hypothetical protein
MSQLLNITGSRVVEDPSFRYKMPRLVCRIEGRGNGIRTCIVNLTEISDSLNRPPDILTKYFGVELGAQSRYEVEVRAHWAQLLAACVWLCCCPCSPQPPSPPPPPPTAPRAWLPAG